MEITRLSEVSIKIKSKFVSLVINPSELKPKIAADGFLFFEKGATKDTIDGLVMRGPGEYEIKSVKITGIGTSMVTVYKTRLEGINVFIGKASGITKSKDMIQECDLAVLYADVVLPESVFTSLNANAIVLFGQAVKESAQSVGKTIQESSKYTVTRDKLPQELEFISLA